MTPTTIQKYSKLSTSNLKARAIRVFNKWIRERDKEEPCICCGKFGALQAGHFYSAGKYNHMRFNPDNVHGQLKGCNYYKSGNLLEYRKRLIEKIGEERVKKLDRLAEQRGAHRTDRYLLIETIETYSPIKQPKKQKMKASEARAIAETKIPKEDSYKKIIDAITKRCNEGKTSFFYYCKLDAETAHRLRIDGYKMKSQGNALTVISW